MAEAYRLSLHKFESKVVTNQDENYCVLNVLCVFISLVTILADLTTDILVFAEYCHDGHLHWAIGTLVFILTPNILINIFSIRWFVSDQKATFRHWITHGFLVGLLERYVIFLYKAFSCKNLETIKTQKWVSQRNDLSLLHFLYVFTGTIPQIILQSYAIILLGENYYTKAFALSASVASVIWSCTTYIYNTVVFSKETFQWSSLTLKLVWHFSMIIGRIPSILIFALVFGIWALIPFGLHWAAMTFWIILQKTTFCSNKLEETLYNVVMGFVYCFCYINLREGNTRYRLIMFYTLIVTQNFGSLLLYILISDSNYLYKPWSIGATACIVTGTVIGISTMIMYYKCCNEKNSKGEEDSSRDDIELNNKVEKQNISNNKATPKYVRSFKTSDNAENYSKFIKYKKKKYTKTTVPPEPVTIVESQTTDKKNLLDNWVGISGTTALASPTVTNNSTDVSSIEVFTIENTPQSGLQDKHYYSGTSKTFARKQKSIYSPTELMLKLSAIENLESSIDEITTNNLNMQKRRGICSSDELRDDLNINLDMVNENFMKTIKADHSSEISQDTDGSNKKTSSDSIDMDLDLSFSDINSSDINTFNENIVQKLCLSALKNIKVGNQDADIENIQRIALDILKEMYTKKDKSKTKINKESFHSKNRDIDTPTEVLSVHDYENICAVNIAREAWGLRSWNCYSDIENCQHDGSVVRDRRGDTLTSESSEISSCLSQELKNAILAAPPFSKKTPTYSNVSMKFERSQEDYVNTTITRSNEETYLAKPCVTDVSKDQSHLEPIIEELDDLGDMEIPTKKRLNSESSLVATIDEIRKAFVTNSPRNLYHRRDNAWNSPECGESLTIENNLKRALWKEPSKFDSSNILESLPEKENILNFSHGSKFDSNKIMSSILEVTPSTGSFDIDNERIGIRNEKRHQKSNIYNLNLQNKKSNIKSDQLQDLSNNDIDLLWQLVSENSLPQGSAEDLTSNQISTSLQSLIQKDPSTPSVNSSAPKISNIKKGARSKPRRKFSILRERFEPKPNINSDKEILCQSKEVLYSMDSNIVNFKNHLDLKNEIHKTEVKNKSTVTTADILSTKSIKEKRSLFMKQVLSPPKFNTKLRHKM